ncbi:MAG TPA: hypothetical protein VLW48_01025 [Candidatus Bathyarchaeia archaeon]|nr:hypothetical protein [Candidatus Bathyarchaeia archaeon]
MIHNAKELSAEQKAVIENLLGRRVLESEAISVRAFEPPALSAERRETIAEQLRRYFAELDEHRQPASPQEADEVITEAIRSVRPGYRSHS